MERDRFGHGGGPGGTNNPRTGCEYSVLPKWGEALWGAVPKDMVVSVAYTKLVVRRRLIGRLVEEAQAQRPDMSGECEVQTCCQKGERKGAASITGVGIYSLHD